MTGVFSWLYQGVTLTGTPNGEPRKYALIVQIPGSLRFGSFLFCGKIDILGRGEKNGGKIDAMLSGEGKA